jgi:hypothetical protein
VLVDGIAQALQDDGVDADEAEHMAYKLDSCIWWLIRSRREQRHPSNTLSWR